MSMMILSGICTGTYPYFQGKMTAVLSQFLVDNAKIKTDDENGVPNDMDDDHIR